VGVLVLSLVVLQNFIYKRFWSKGLTVKIKFSAKEAFEGDRLYLTEEVTNGKFLPLPWLFLSFNISRHLVFFDNEGNDNDTEIENQNELFSMMMFQRVRRKIPFKCAKRGVYRFKRVTLTASNLLHTRQFSKDFKAVNKLTVFPRIIDASELEIIYKRMDAELLSHQLINPDPFEFRGIREYQPTDPAHTVNFKATAVAQQLMVNIHAPVSSKRLHVILNLEPYTEYSSRELFEYCIRLAASVAGHYVGDNVNVALSTNGRDLDIATRGGGINLRGGASTAHLYTIYEALARIDLTFKVTPISEFVDTIRDYEAVYLMISAYHKDDLLDSLEALRSRGGTVYTVVPYLGGTEIEIAETEYLSTWEVAM